MASVRDFSARRELPMSSVSDFHPATLAEFNPEALRGWLPTPAERLQQLRSICYRDDWANLLCRRWSLCMKSLRKLQNSGHLGSLYRRSLHTYVVLAENVYDFEVKYAIPLGVGEKALTRAEVRRRYGISNAALLKWRKIAGFPAFIGMPVLKVERVPLRHIKEWERLTHMKPACELKVN